KILSKDDDEDVRNKTDKIFKESKFFDDYVFSNTESIWQNLKKNYASPMVDIDPAKNKDGYRGNFADN
ncbi:MAG: hypothetical protein OEL89_05465, partial [Candidatus Peregrinibacteria bacterium]|nr:hypothetical protein [Candidatus Peregrinibacteria bacterium]